MNRLRAAPFAALRAASLVALCALFAGPAAAGGRLPCEEARVFQGAAVNAFVLPYRYTSGKQGDTSSTGARLAALIQQEVLFAMLKYGAIGATELYAPSASACDVREAIARVTRGNGPGTLQPGHALAIIWGRIYEEGSEVYVQSYIRFLRRDRDEAIEVALQDALGAQLALNAPLPAQAVAMPPRRMTQQDVREIEQRARETLVLHAAPDAYAAKRPLGRGHDEPLSYGVTQVRGEWMYVQSQITGEAGWVRARSDTDAWALRRFLPELGYLDGVIGYLRLRTVDRMPLTTDARRMYGWVANAFDAYARALRPQGAPEALALARALQGVLLWTVPALAPEGGHRREAARMFDTALEQMPESSALRTLAAVTSPWLQTEPALTRAAFARVDAGLLGALAVDQSNQNALRNLERVYAYAAERPDGSGYAPDAARARLDLVRRSLAQSPAPQ